ncbi:MAG: DNA topoisomerase 3 [Clostridia bacterium]|nr:DNA topoisomerase 3 [Clostridia bacterium]
MKTLVVAEKPSVGRDIARVLKATARGEGFLSGDNYIVTWAVGHLVSLKEPDELDEKYSKWNRNDLPILPADIPLKVLTPTRSQFKVVKQLMNDKDVDKIICATDSGREGELIFRYIYQMAGCKKPFDRLWISSMTDAAIKAGFDSLKPSKDYDGLYASARCRSEADWLVGMNATRAFTLRYNRLLSVGRVQTPTLALIVKRDGEIAAFVPEEYYELTAEFEAWKGVWFDPETKSTHIKDKAAAEEIAKRVKGKTGRVAEVKREQKRVPPQKLYDLTTLQREANRKFGFSADKTLKIAQSLYETHKLITYPRTDSRYLPDDMIPKVKHTLSLLPEPYDALVKQATLDFARRIYDNSKISDHHAIIPTDRKGDLSRLTQDERKIFDLVAKRLISNHYGDYVYDALNIVTAVGGDQFKTALNALVDPGWKAVYAGDDTEKTDAQADLPEVNENDLTKLLKTSIKQQKTKPPAFYTDDTLLKAMEDAGKTIEDEELREKMKDAGLGTPATRAAIIQRLIQVGYAKRERKNIISTVKGQKLIEVVPKEISSAVTTGKWERALAKMARFTDEAEISEKQGKFMNSIRAYSTFLTDYAFNGAPHASFPQEERYAKRRNPNAAKPKKHD